MHLFVTGTDTGVGKTYFTSLFLRALRQRGVNAVGMKPIACGAQNDVAAIASACDYQGPSSDLNPVSFEQPLAPLTAAVLSGTQVDLDGILSSFAGLTAKYSSVIVEGAGGWLVPILPDYFMADLAIAFQIPVLIVVDNKLGALNHTMLTVDSLQRRGVSCAGIILNNRDGEISPAAATNRAILETMLPIPIRVELQPGQTEMDLSGFQDLLPS